jgi:NADH-quinone oxidoreductase subunit N
MKAEAPGIDFAALAPLLAVGGGAIVVLLLGLARARFVRETVVTVVAFLALLVFLGVSIWQWGTNQGAIEVEGSRDFFAMRTDDFAMALNVLFAIAGLATVVLSWRAAAPRESAHGEYYALLLTSIAGMTVLVAAQDTITLFLGFELLSIPLYVLCATEMRRATSLESGLKYLVIGSVGSATLVYGLALLYGATATTSYEGMARALESQGGLANDPLTLGGVALVVVGLMFKSSVAPFHQWTPDVYQGAPTPVTAFMAVATKVAAFGVLLRFFDVALIATQPDWGVALAVLATVSIVIGNVGALTQTSLKRLLAWSSVAQAGYLLAGVVIGTRAGLEATVIYLAVYLVMNLAAFAVVAARERETPFGDHIDAVTGIGGTRPLLAWPMTIAMLSLAGIPATGGFIGKFALIEAVTEDGYAWLGVVIVLGSAVSLAYYLRVIVAMWMRPAPVGSPAAAAARPAGARPLLAGGAVSMGVDGGGSGDGGGGGDGSGDALRDQGDAPVAESPVRRRVHPEVVAVAVIAAIVTLAAGVYPEPLFDLAREVGASLGNPLL